MCSQNGWSGAIFSNICIGTVPGHQVQISDIESGKIRQSFTQHRIVGNFLGRKLSQISRFCGYSRKFMKYRGVVSLGTAKVNNPWKFSPQKLYFSPIRKSFLPQKFPTIRYYVSKNTWVTLTTFLGCRSCISVTKECYQIGFLNWKFIEELFFSSIC